jgi:glycosyltransferase involved in cell wall biosynthesis
MRDFSPASPTPFTERRRRVGLVLTGGVDRSGRERVIPVLLGLIERLARRHDLHVFVLRHYRDPCDYDLLGATVHDLGRTDGVPGFGRFRQERRLLGALSRIGSFDLLHAYWAVPAGVVTTRVARRLGIPSIVTFDSGELVSMPDIGYGLQRRWIDRRAVTATARAASRITVCTDYMARLARDHGIDTQQLPLGINPRWFPSGDTDDGPPWRLLHVASLNAVKDHATLLRAMSRIVAQTSEVHLDIVGEDTLDRRVHRLCQSLGLGAHVSFHGFQPTANVAVFYARAHLHVVSSRHEAAGAVSLEAACAGVATVGTSVGYVADWAGDRAVAVPVADPEALATAILSLLADPVRRARVAAAARSWALAHDADWTADQFAHLYAQVSDKHARRLASTSR